MIVSTIGEFLDPKWEFPEESDEIAKYHSLYLVLDLDRLPLYLGKAFSPAKQLFDKLMPGHSLGALVNRMRPASLSWPVEFYNPQDCELVVARQFPDRLEEFRKSLRDENRIKYAQSYAYEALMQQLSPCLNSFANPNQKPLPKEYLSVITLPENFISPVETIMKKIDRTKLSGL